MPVTNPELPGLPAPPGLVWPEEALLLVSPGRAHQAGMERELTLSCKGSPAQSHLAWEAEEEMRVLLTACKLQAHGSGKLRTGLAGNKATNCWVGQE